MTIYKQGEQIFIVVISLNNLIKYNTILILSKYTFLSIYVELYLEMPSNLEYKLSVNNYLFYLK